MALLPLSLLDRLLDDAPDMVVEPMVDDDRTFERFKLGLRRDLEGLLNGKRPYASWLARSDSLQGSLPGFGLPDISTEDFSTPAVRERIRRLIAATIRTHEPRLQHVEVETEGAPSSTGVRFRIYGVVRLAGADEPVVYDAQLRPTDRVIAIDLAG